MVSVRLGSRQWQLGSGHSHGLRELDAVLGAEPPFFLIKVAQWRVKQKILNFQIPHAP